MSLCPHIHASENLRGGNYCTELIKHTKFKCNLPVLFDCSKEIAQQTTFIKTSIFIDDAVIIYSCNRKGIFTQNFKNNFSDFFNEVFFGGADSSRSYRLRYERVVTQSDAHVAEARTVLQHPEIEIVCFVI